MTQPAIGGWLIPLKRHSAGARRTTAASASLAIALAAWCSPAKAASAPASRSKAASARPSLATAAVARPSRALMPEGASASSGLEWVTLPAATTPQPSGMSKRSPSRCVSSRKRNSSERSTPRRAMRPRSSSRRSSDAAQHAAHSSRPTSGGAEGGDDRTTSPWTSRDSAAAAAHPEPATSTRMLGRGGGSCGRGALEATAVAVVAGRMSARMTAESEPCSLRPWPTAWPSMSCLTTRKRRLPTACDALMPSRGSGSSGASAPAPPFCEQKSSTTTGRWRS
mmetsp:Transcript_22131/g.73427  ORF Transcript_22131/g.73427 Transcript_22131/m.73427 type:complete len:281 (-) Transcript_22131:1232-2074(-)